MYTHSCKAVVTGVFNVLNDLNVLELGKKTLLMHFEFQCIIHNKVMDWSKSFQFNLLLNFSQFNRNKVTGLHCLSFFMQHVPLPGQLWEELNQTQNHARAVFRLTTNDLLLSATLETLKLCYMGSMVI